MLAIYKYTLFKYFKSWSTWVVMAFSAIVLGFLIGGMLPFIFIDVTKHNAAQIYSKAIVLTIAGVTVFFGIFSAIFAGFKSATMYKDEVENGTFLVLISKPIKRSELIFGKWFALQTLLIIYSCTSVLALCSGVMIFDNGNQIPGLKSVGIGSLKASIWHAAIYVFLILYITSLIFSSLGIMISTKLSAASTVGVVIALGIYIPISGLIGMFVRKDEAYPVSREETTSKFVEDRLFSEMKSNPLIEMMYPNLKTEASDFFNSTDATKIYNQAVYSGQEDSYKGLFWLDVDYQFKLLSSFAYETLIPEKYVSALQNSSVIESAMQTPQAVIATTNTKAIDFFKQIEKYIDNFSKVSDDLVQMIAWKNLLELQPLSTKDIATFMSSNESQGLIVKGKESQLIKEIANIDLSKNFNLDMLQQFLKNNADCFNDVKTTITTFLKWAVTTDKRDDTNFLIKDTDKIKIAKSRLSDIDTTTWQAYAYNDKKTKYQIHNEYPKEFFDDLQNKFNFSSDLVDFLRELNHEIYDKNYEYIADDKSVSSDFRNIDFKLYKKWMIMNFLQEHDATTGIVKYPFRNMASEYIYKNRVDSNNETIIDDSYIRGFSWQIGFWHFINDQAMTNKKPEIAKVVNSTEGLIMKMLSPISSFLLKDARHFNVPDVDIQARHIVDIRKSLDPGYSSIEKYNTTKYKSPLEDPLTNLSTDDLASLELSLSAMIDNQMVQYKTEPYADRKVLLGVYAAVAILLVPVTYLVVRRQDFR